MSEAPGVLTAFVAGLLSFLSPCVLPLIPSYLSVLTGSALSELRDSSSAEKIRARVLFRSLAFSLGFSIVFVALGFILSSSASMLGGASRTWGIAAGIAVVVLGLNIVFDFLKFLNFEARAHAGKRPSGFLGAMAFGAAFAAGWSPCVGPILASILLVAGRGTSARAMLLLSVYSLGLALPFVLTGAFFSRLEGVLKAMTARLSLIKTVSGAFLILIGVSMIAGNFQGINGLLARAGYALADVADKHATLVGAATAILFGIAALGPFIFAVTAKKERASTAARRPAVFVPFVLFVPFAVAELAGWISFARLLSSWLLYQGI